MPLTEERAISNSYPVEASGWDIAHFFCREVRAWLERRERQAPHAHPFALSRVLDLSAASANHLPGALSSSRLPSSACRSHRRRTSTVPPQAGPAELRFYR